MEFASLLLAALLVGFSFAFMVRKSFEHFFFASSRRVCFCFADLDSMTDEMTAGEEISVRRHTTQTSPAREFWWICMNDYDIIELPRRINNSELRGGLWHSIDSETATNFDAYFQLKFTSLAANPQLSP